MIDFNSDSWWATSRGPIVAAQIKFATDEILDLASVFNPETAELSAAQEELLDKLKVAGEAIRGAIDDHRSVKMAVKSAAESAANEIVKIKKENYSKNCGRT